jgi:DNA-directed RNA polymerase specialized sigma24 family protein/HEAT repeat protein
MSRAEEPTDKTTVPPYGERVMALRAERGWSQLTLATRAGCSEGTIRRVEEGERTRYTTLVLIAKAFGMSPQELLRTEKYNKLTLVIHINEYMFSCPEEAMIEALKRIRQLIGDSKGLQVISVSQGSIKVSIALGPDDALRLLAAIDERELDECGVESASLEESGDEHRDTSVAPLWQFGSEPRDSVSALVRLLEAEDPAIRRFAARAIARIGDVGAAAAEVVPALAGLARDPDPDLREQAAVALARIGEGVVSALLGLVHDPDPGARGRDAKRGARRSHHSETDPRSAVDPPGALMNDPSSDSMRTHPSQLQLLRDPSNREAWGRFIARYGPMIRGWCRHWFPREADERAYEVYSELVFRMITFEYDPSQRRFRGWLKAETHRLMAKLKDEGWPQSDEKHDPQVSLEATEDLAARLAAEFDLELLEQAKDRVRERVPPRTWAAYLATAEEGQKPAEVARHLGMRVGAVFQAKHSVISMLRQEIEKSQGPA